MKRIVVFFDWQNVYKRCRGALFGDHTQDNVQGQVFPHLTAQLLRDRVYAYASTRPDHPLHGQDLELSEIRIYRGAPRNDRDPKAYDAFQRQTRAWKSVNNRTFIVKREIHYPRITADQPDSIATTTEKPREKGIDVSLAVDLVTMGVKHEYDHAIVFSSDMDLAPALEFVIEQNIHDATAPSVSAAAWKGGSRLRTNTQGRNLFVHWLNMDDYEGVKDDRNYADANGRSARPTPGPR